MNYKSRGFSLVEMVVVMAIFLIVIGITIIIFLSIIKQQKVILSEQKILNQLSYAQEYISKALRMAKVDNSGNCMNDSLNNTGYMYLLTRPSGANFQGVKFINGSNGDVCTEFYLDVADHVLKEVKYDKITQAAGSPVSLTSTDLTINSIQFAVDGVDWKTTQTAQGANNKKSQPRLTILFNVKIEGDDTTTARLIQTTISARNIIE